MSQPYDDEVIMSPDEPMLDQLAEEYRRTAPFQNNWNRLNGSDDIRFMRWEDQWADGKKHDTDSQQAFPWDGASDLTSPKMADDIINMNAEICQVAFWRAMLRLEGVEPNDYANASNMGKLLEFYRRNAMLEELMTEVELASQYIQNYGWCVLHPTWSREIGLKMYEVHFQDFVELAQQVAAEEPENPIGALPQMIKDPANEDDAVELLKVIYTDYVRKNVHGLEEDEIPEVKEKRIRKVVQDLRKDDKAALPMPYFVRNHPSIIALKPWEEVVFSDDTTEIQRSKMFVRYFFSETELRDRARAAGWDKKWVEEAVKLKGKFTDWAYYNSNYVNDGDWHFQDQASYYSSIEIVYAYTRRFDEEGISGVYLTVFHPGVGRADDGKKDLVAEHGMLDYQHGEIPGILATRERWTRNFTFCRGVPTVVASHQREAKLQRDSIVDRTALTTTPSIAVPASNIDSQYVFGPGQQIPTLPGREPKFMDVPANDGMSLALIELLGAEMDNYFGTSSEKVHPARSFTKQSKMVMSFLMAWQLAFRQVIKLMQQYMPKDEYVRIMGSEPEWSDDPREISGQYDTVLQFDPRELDFDFVQKKLEAITNLVVPTDTAGAIDRFKLVTLQLQAIDPAIGQAITSDRAGANQKLFDEVQTDLALIFLGNQPQPVENDPTAKHKLDFAGRIIQSNPRYMESLQKDPQGVFATGLQKWAENLQFSVTQQRNAQIGRTGVEPE